MLGEDQRKRYDTYGAWLVPLLAITLAMGILWWTGPDDERFRIDEAHKISETYFYRLLEEGDLSNPDWLRHPVDRSNPPVGKFLFGLSMRMQGIDRPRDLSVARFLEVHRVHEPPKEVAAHYRSALAPIRRVSLISATLLAAVLAWAAFRLSGTLAALLTTSFYLGSDLTRGYARAGVFDPMLTLIATLTLIPLVVLWKRKGEAAWLGPAIAAGLLAGIASQVRLSGAIVFAGILGVTILLIITTRRWVHLRIAAAAVLSAAITATAINPFYWSIPSTTRGLVDALSGNEMLPLRIVQRYQIQLRDLSAILGEVTAHRSLSIDEKLQFFTEQVTGDWAGLVMFLGAAIAIGTLLVRRFRNPAVLFVAVWSLSIVISFLFWLPVAWPRYGLFIVPMMALMGGTGWARILTSPGVFSSRVVRPGPPNPGEEPG